VLLPHFEVLCHVVEDLRELHHDVDSEDLRWVHHLLLASSICCLLFLLVLVFVVVSLFWLFSSVVVNLLVLVNPEALSLNTTQLRLVRRCLGGKLSEEEKTLSLEYSVWSTPNSKSFFIPHIFSRAAIVFLGSPRHSAEYASISDGPDKQLAIER